MWAITFTSGYLTFVIFDTEEHDTLTEDHNPADEEHDQSTEEHDTSTDVWWINGINAFFLGIGLALSLVLVYRDRHQDYRRTAWEAGLAWYVIMLLMDLIVLVGLLGLELELWLPEILIDSIVLIIPIVVGHLLASSGEES